MKVIATVRTRNEERNVERFCRSYQWTDKILIADGESEDNTVAIAREIPKVEVRTFSEWIPMDNGLRRNPHGKTYKLPYRLGY